MTPENSTAAPECFLCDECAVKMGFIPRAKAFASMPRSPWLDASPPKDGKPIVAIGRVIWRDEYSTSVDSFVALVRWEKDQSGYEGWHFDHDGMTVARTLDDEVMVDYWLPPPETASTVVPQNPNKLL